MRRTPWGLAAPLLLVLGTVGWWAVAQESDETLTDEPTAASEDLAAIDAGVMDATAEVEAGAQPEAPPAAWPAGDPVPPDLGAYQVSLHTDGTALVQRRQTVDLNEGENEIIVDGVPAELLPDTVALRAVDPTVVLRVLEQAGGPGGSTDRLTSAVGSPVAIRADGKQLVEGTLLGVDDAGLAVRSDSGLHLIPLGAEVVVPEAEPGLDGRLVFTVEAERAQQAEVEVTYLTRGLRWAADYALYRRPGEALVSLEGWVRVVNQSGADLAAAGLLFLDQPSLEPGDEAAKPTGEPHTSWLTRPVDLPAGTAKRLALCSVPAARSRVRTLVELDVDGLASMRRVAELKNDAATGLGLPLPPGPVRVYTADPAGRPRLTGRMLLPATAVDSSLAFELGEAGDLEVTVQTATGDDGSIRRTVRLRNLSTADQPVRLTERREGAWRIAEATAPFAPPAEGAATSEVIVPANKALEVKFRVAPPAPPQG